MSNEPSKGDSGIVWLVIGGALLVFMCIGFPALLAGIYLSMGMAPVAPLDTAPSYDAPAVRPMETKNKDKVSNQEAKDISKDK